MKTIPTLLRAILLLTIALFTTRCAGTPDTVVDGVTYSGKWRIKCNKDAASDGHVQFRIIPKGEAPIDVTINIVKYRGENDVAKDITTTLSQILDKKRFHVERDDWEDVLIKKKGNGPDFTVQLISSSIQGTSFKIELD